MKDMTEREIVAMFSSLVRRLLGDEVVSIRWFGSRAKGIGASDSDYDIMIETKRALTEAQRDAVADVTVDVTADYGVLFDVHYYTTAEIHGRPYGRAPFVLSVLEEGVVV